MGPAIEIASLLACWALLLAPGAPHSPGDRDYILGALEEYRLVIPTSTDSEGRFLSKVVSGAPRGRFRRDTLGNLPHETTNEQIFYNVTVFGREFHFRLRPNTRLVSPGATVEWQVDDNITYIEPLHGNCLYVGDITDLPNASVAISNCDGLGVFQRGIPGMMYGNSFFLSVKIVLVFENFNGFSVKALSDWYPALKNSLQKTHNRMSQKNLHNQSMSSSIVQPTGYSMSQNNMHMQMPTAFSPHPLQPINCNALAVLPSLVAQQPRRSDLCTGCSSTEDVLRS